MRLENEADLSDFQYFAARAERILRLRRQGTTLAKQPMTQLQVQRQVEELLC